MKRTKTIAITSGKGGVGKTTLISNIGLRLSQLGKKVLILDGDLGMANVDIMFGVRSKGTIHDVINGDRSLRDVMVEVSRDLWIIPGGSGIEELSRLNSYQRQAMMDSIRHLPVEFDYLLIDTAPGLGENVLYLNAAAQQVSVIITPDPTSFADAYALIKVLNHQMRIQHFAIICNQVMDEKEGVSLFHRFTEVVDKFLFVGLDYWGSVPMDEELRDANQNQRLILKHQPMADSAKAIRFVSSQLERALMAKGTSRAGLQQFWEQVVGVA